MRRLAQDAHAADCGCGDAAAQGGWPVLSPKRRLRVSMCASSAGESDGNDAARLLHLPDEVLSRLESGEALATSLPMADAGAPGCIQLAQSLLSTGAR